MEHRRLRTTGDGNDRDAYAASLVYKPTAQNRGRLVDEGGAGSGEIEEREGRTGEEEAWLAS